MGAVVFTRGGHQLYVRETVGEVLARIQDRPDDVPEAFIDLTLYDGRRVYVDRWQVVGYTERHGVIGGEPAG